MSGFRKKDDSDVVVIGGDEPVGGGGDQGGGGESLETEKIYPSAKDASGYLQSVRKTLEAGSSENLTASFRNRSASEEMYNLKITAASAGNGLKLWEKIPGIFTKSFSGGKCCSGKPSHRGKRRGECGKHSDVYV